MSGRRMPEQVAVGASRRRFLACAVAAGATVPLSTLLELPSWGQEPAAAPAVSLATRRAIEAGLQFLVSRQTTEGSFGAEGYARNVAVCSLAGMAFLSQGSLPRRGAYGVPLERCIDFVLRCAQDSGYIVTPGREMHGPMYGHGFATMFLAEAYGTTARRELRDKLSRGVRLLIHSQNHEGGWRYHPDSRDADISVTVCQVMALRAARNAGIYVPSETIERAVDYVKQCQNPDGGFMYMLPRNDSAFPRSAAGVVTLYGAGIYDSDEVRRGLDYLLANADAIERTPGGNGHYFYGQYYAIQAMWLAGGRYWQQWYPRVHQALLAQQRPDGAWADVISPEYGTAMACLILQIPSSYLPIFQR